LRLFEKTKLLHPSNLQNFILFFNLIVGGGRLGEGNNFDKKKIIVCLGDYHLYHLGQS